MKLGLRLWLSVALLTGFAAAQSPAAAFSLVISTPHTTVRAGEPVPLTIVMTNKSDHDTGYGRVLGGIPSSIFDVYVLNKNNRDVPETAYGQKRHGTAPGELIGGSVFGFKLPPGNSMHEDLMLNKEWDISESGTYKIHVERFDPPSNMTVKSNVIVLTVQ